MYFICSYFLLCYVNLSYLLSISGLYLSLILPFDADLGISVMHGCRFRWCFEYYRGSGRSMLPELINYLLFLVYVLFLFLEVDYFSFSLSVVYFDFEMHLVGSYTMTYDYVTFMVTLLRIFLLLLFMRGSYSFNKPYLRFLCFSLFL